MIQHNIEKYDDTFLTKRFANKYLTDRRTLRVGNIISFVSPVSITIEDKKCESEQSINFCLELPDISSYAGVCFQRLFITNVANILAVKYCNEPFEIQNNDIIIKKEHKNGGINQVDGVISLSQIRQVNDAILIYLGLYNHAGSNSQPRAYSLQLEEEVMTKFMDSVNENFYHLANGIFLSTAKM